MSKKLEDRDITLNDLHQLMRAHPKIDWKTIVSETIKGEKVIKKMKKDPLRYYAYKRLAEEGEDADKLFEY